MGKNVKKSGLAARLGTAGEKAVAAHREDETRLVGGSRLPEGIENGVAQLVDCDFRKYEKGPNKGEYFFIARGVVKRPNDVNGIKVAGLHTQIMEPVCDTPQAKGQRKTLDDHVDWIMNEFRKLGVDTSELDLSDLEQAAADLKEAAPHFTFRTWKGEPTKEFPNPRVNEQWAGLCDFTDEDDEDDVTDETPEDEGDEDEEEEEQPKKKAKKAKEPEPEEEEEEEEEESEDEEEEEAEEEETDEPEKDEVYSYKPAGKKRAVQCEVTAVNRKDETVTLKDLNDGKVYKNVPWDDLVAD